MISAFSAASNTATPRSFQLTADDVSKNALSVFIGSFILQHRCFSSIKKWLLW
jgi:uncharacterized membrane protein